MKFPHPETLDFLRRVYVGRKIRFVKHLHPDPAPLIPGQTGICDYVDDAGTLHIKWDDGRTLGLITEADVFQIISNWNS